MISISTKEPLTQDQRIVHHGRTWRQFKLIQEGFENAPGVRLSFYAGTIEIFMPGQAHETFASIIGCLLMIYLAQKGVAFVPTRSMTQEKEGVASAQADESYCINGLKSIADLSIEVVFTSGGLEKLPRYQALEVPEVWFWEDGTLQLHHLRRTGYERIDRSELPGLEDLDINLLKRYILIAETDAGEAIRVFQSEIQN